MYIFYRIIVHKNPAFSHHKNLDLLHSPMMRHQLLQSKQQYQALGKEGKIRNTNIHFTIVFYKLKKKCYPPDESVILNETSAEIKLQPLLYTTVKRLTESLQEKILQSSEDVASHNLHLFCKWGMDGSSGHILTSRFLLGG